MANILFSSYSPNLSIFLKQIIIREIKFGKIFLNLTQIPFIEYKHILMLLTNLSAITKLLSGSHSQTTYVGTQRSYQEQNSDTHHSYREPLLLQTRRID